MRQCNANRASRNNIKCQRGKHDMKHAIEAIINEEPHLDGSLIGINIRSFQTGNVIYDHFGHTRMNPASNMKLLTAASALSVLGEDYIFTTEILMDGKMDQNVLNGNLYIKGKGDPTLLPSDLEDFAKALKKQGISEITGDIIGDDTRYDNERLSPGIVWNDEDYYYAAQISALNICPDEDYDTGSITVEISPAKEIGQEPHVDVLPANTYVSVRNDAITTD